MPIARDLLVRHLDQELESARYHDQSQNGLQVEGRAEVRVLATAASASLAAISQAVAAGADALLVHHGLLWGTPQAITGALARRLTRLLGAGCSLIAYHIPLDAHPQSGNNAWLCRALELGDLRPFGAYKGIPISFCGRLAQPQPLARLIQRLEQTVCHPVRHCPGGPDPVQQVAVLSGGGCRWLAEAASSGAEVLVTGDAAEQSWHEAAELGCHLLACGHHATECLAVHDLGAELARRFDLRQVRVVEDNPL